MILAVDGGNSKTDAALIDDGGGVLAHARGPLSSPHHLGLDGCLAVLQQLVEEIGLTRRRADVANVLLAGIDFPDEEADLQLALDAREWARRPMSATTPTPCCGPAPSGAGALRSRAAQGSTASASRPTVGSCVTQRSGRQPATGAAATTSAKRGSRPRRAVRTDGAPRPSSSASCLRILGSTRRSSVARQIHAA